MSKIYTIWVDYGLEGWRPNDFDDEEEAIEFVMAGDFYGQIRITEQKSIKITPN
jgi:hypothetical protein